MALYEMRTYTLYVGKMAEAQKLYTELGFPALKKGGHDKNLVGYFVADTGMINQLVHIWKFKDDGDRRAHWAAVFANKDFIEGFASKFRPLVMSQEVKADDRGAVGAASVRGRRQAPGPRSQIDGGDDLISAPYRGGGDREMRELCISQGEHRVAGSAALA
jgi:hypothetical protein